MKKSKTNNNPELITKMEELVKSLQTDGKEYLKKVSEENKKRAEEENQRAAAAKTTATVVEDGQSSHLFVDDLQLPYTVNCMEMPTGEIWRVVTSYDSFVEYIEKYGIPEFISFDFDLGRGKKSGLDCLEWLMKYCIEQKQSKLPVIICHSSLRSHVQLIEGKLLSYSKMKRTAGL